jgi:hypothetical protein
MTVDLLIQWAIFRMKGPVTVSGVLERLSCEGLPYAEEPDGKAVRAFRKLKEADRRSKIEKILKMGNPRLAQTMGAAEGRQWTAHERYMLYCQGFRDGASTTAIRHSGFPDYERGYGDGIGARGTATDAFAKEIGYKPTILRTQG